MQYWVQVFLGGMLGAVMRFSVQSFTTTITMLWIANVLGSFVLGSLNGYFQRKESKWLLFLTTGMLGAFTTFSTFTENWFHLLQKNVLIGLLFGIGMTVASVLAAFVGYNLNRGKRKWNGS